MSCASAVLVEDEHRSHRAAAKSSLSLPNILTYARIAAIPVVVGSFTPSRSWTARWLRWVAVAVFIAAGVTDLPRWLYARSGVTVGVRPDAGSIADKLWSHPASDAFNAVYRAAGRCRPIVILYREILVSGLRNILRLARQRAGDPRQMENTAQLVAIGSCSPAGQPWWFGITLTGWCCCGSRRLSRSTPVGIIPRRGSSPHRRMRHEGEVFRLGARASARPRKWSIPPPTAFVPWTMMAWLARRDELRPRLREAG